MIVVKIKGGLGNQMFEYAMARYFQLELDQKRIGLDLSIINGDDIRDFGLQHFQLFEGVEVLEKSCRITKWQQWLAKKIVSYLIAGRKEWIAGRREELCSTFFALFGIVQRDHSMVRQKYLLKFHRNIYMNGWFQTADKLLPIRDVLIRDFTWKSENILKDKLYSRIVSSNAVCVHIRRGDYVNHPLYDVCGEKYYYHALEYLNGILIDPVFFVFSDSIQEVADTMEFPVPVVLVEEKHQDYEDLFLMKHCKHFIMSNSTYSWWAQFLSEERNKIVVAPRKWCLMEDMYIGVYMENWVLMDEM